MSGLHPRLGAALTEAGVPYRENEPFARHTTMGVGGPAAVMAFPRTTEELGHCLALRAELGVPHRVLGAGSNLVVVDEGLDELIVNTEALTTVVVADGHATAEAGANLIRTVMRSTREGWRGLERAAGIPGSVGGAAVMNAGAYGFSLSDILENLLVFDADGNVLNPPGGWSFRYRGSSIPEGAAVARVTVRLTAEDPAALERETRELSAQRVRSQPGGRNAGCVFKNPEGAAAGRLIDEVGLKGTRVGGVVVSERHANFLVNDAQGTASDVLALLERVHDAVLRATGVDLDLEVKVWRPTP
jgi:UDP-N-acetylmuramate dehydrogenase